MLSTLECFHHAARCEEQAEDTSNDNDKAALLEMAAQWRKLGNQAKVWDDAKTAPFRRDSRGR